MKRGETRALGIRLESPLLDLIDERAKAAGVSRSTLIEEYLARAFHYETAVARAHRCLSSLDEKPT